MENLKTNINSMDISNKRLSEFKLLFESKTGKKLDEPEALKLAETLLRTISILYKPVSTKDYYSAMVQKMILKLKRCKMGQIKND